MLVYAQQKNSLRGERRARELFTDGGDPAERAVRAVRGQRTAFRRRQKTKGHSVGWLKVVLLLTCIGLVFIWQRVQAVRVGREVHDLYVARRQLRDEVRDLRAMFEKRTGYETVRQRAEHELGFVAPPVEILEVDGE